jgi:hypothetical protein
MGNITDFSGILFKKKVYLDSPDSTIHRQEPEYVKKRYLLVPQVKTENVTTRLPMAFWTLLPLSVLLHLGSLGLPSGIWKSTLLFAFYAFIFFYFSGLSTISLSLAISSLFEEFKGNSSMKNIFFGTLYEGRWWVQWEMISRLSMV